ncbi:hypothetical protein ELB75_08580 [Eikenella corrodens]|uniref:Uncharacterized protein n=1 Tax=Eikenella corrodens TaxID=539 RepID=A0A3S9SMV3_EIKCO|nr:hypothetical protein ELB75_08580 [Eikenella corrodens]
MLSLLTRKLYSGLNLNQYSVVSPCRNVCTVCGSPPCPDLNLIHYTFTTSWYSHPNPTYIYPKPKAT